MKGVVSACCECIGCVGADVAVSVVIVEDKMVLTACAECHCTLVH